jgi:hypothetical protein
MWPCIWDSTWSGRGSVAGSCENSNEHLGSIKGEVVNQAIKATVFLRRIWSVTLHNSTLAHRHDSANRDIHSVME